MRTGAIGALAASLVWCAMGCENRPAPVDPGPPEPGPPASQAVDPVQITIDVKGMTKALNIT